MPCPRKCVQGSFPSSWICQSRSAIQYPIQVARTKYRRTIPYQSAFWHLSKEARRHPGPITQLIPCHNQANSKATPIIVDGAAPCSSNEKQAYNKPGKNNRYKNSIKKFG